MSCLAKMTTIILIFIVLLIWLNFDISLNKKEVRSELVSVTPTALGFIPPAVAGPNEKLACPQIDVRGSGPLWHGVTVGESSFSEFVAAIGEGEIRVRGVSPNSILLDYADVAGVCVQHGIVVAIDTAASLPFLTDYVAIYGSPDAVTWTSQYHERVIFWFEEGIAVVAWIGSVTEENAPIWVSSEFFFPYQDSDGFESRWPYNATWSEPPIITDVGYEVSTEQNPYDFDAMIATITAEPSRTPTATFTPRPTQSVALTPTPTATLSPE
jgi:hypothetical protein